jgi:hypothetical protein
VLHAAAASSGSAPWLLQPSGSSSVLREQLGEPAGAGQQQLPWASLNASSLAVYLYDDAPL